MNDRPGIDPHFTHPGLGLPLFGHKKNRASPLGYLILPHWGFSPRRAVHPQVVGSLLLQRCPEPVYAPGGGTTA